MPESMPESRDEKEARILLNKRTGHILIKSADFDEPVGLFISGRGESRSISNNFSFSLGLEIFSTYLYRRLRKRKQPIAILRPSKAEEVIDIECKDTINLAPI